MLVFRDVKVPLLKSVTIIFPVWTRVLATPKIWPIWFGIPRKRVRVCEEFYVPYKTLTVNLAVEWYLHHFNKLVSYPGPKNPEAALQFVFFIQTKIHPLLGTILWWRHHWHHICHTAFTSEMMNKLRSWNQSHLPIRAGHLLNLNKLFEDCYDYVYKYIHCINKYINK